MRVYIPENQIGKVRLGARANIRIDTFPDRDFTGQVSYVSAQAEFTPKNVQTQEERVKLVFAVNVAVDNPDGTLKPGMPADVYIQTGRAGQVTIDVAPDLSEAAISTRGLGRAFGDLWAVRGLDLDVQRGEIFGLVGPDGAGKTTTMRLLERHPRANAKATRRSPAIRSGRTRSRSRPGSATCRSASACTAT